MAKSFWRICDEKNNFNEIINDVGFAENVNQQVLLPAINNLLENKTYYKKIIRKCSNLIDGKVQNE